MANLVLIENEDGSGKAFNPSAFISDQCIEISYNPGDESEQPPELHSKYINGERFFCSGVAATTLWEEVRNLIQPNEEAVDEETNDIPTEQAQSQAAGQSQ